MTRTPPIARLIMIDYDKFDHKLCERLVARSGLVGEFISFLSAEDALDYLKSTTLPAADAILLDINMPRMDGFAFLDAATEKFGDAFARVVVVMLTTSLNPHDEDRAKSYEVVKGYCSKPLVAEHLRDIHHLLTTHHGEALERTP